MVRRREQRRRAGQQQRSAEGNLDLGRLQPIGRRQGGQRPRLGPHAMGDGARKAEQPRPKGRGMNRVGVPGHPRISTPQIARKRPRLMLRHFGRRFHLRRRSAAPSAAALQIKALGLPDDHAVPPHRGQDAERLPALMRHQATEADMRTQRLARPQPRILANAVMQVHQTRQGKRKVRAHHQTQMHRKGQDVRPGQGHALSGHETAQPSVGSDRIGIQTQRLRR